VATAAAENMRNEYPGCRIVGCRDGFFTPYDEVDIVAEIREARPDILCVALGIPKQEKWISRHRLDLMVPVAIGVGGTLDVLSGQVKRAPKFIQTLSLEWLYRLVKNPRKIGKVLLLPRFVLLALRNSRSLNSP
jgi:N-acetylglucosaminyldiphosphoundecaprenol N-acetyl-beta-D-mannosaminyltransferase